MYNEFRKESKFVIATVITAVLLLGATATTISNITTENVFAYESNQAKSNLNSCGNGVEPTNIGCQNIDSQIQGDENAVNMIGIQSLPSSLSCEECFNTILTEEQIDDLLLELKDIETIEQYCEFIQSLAPGNRAIVVFFALGFAGIDQDTANEVIDCLRSIGLIPID